MKILGLAVALTAVFTAQQTLAQRDAPNDPASRPIGSADHGAVMGFREEPDSFWVEASKGRFQVVIEPNGRAARKLIHGARSKDFYGGKSIDAVQRDLVNKTGLFDGSKLSSGASILIGITEAGNLVGANKMVGAPAQMRIYEYGLNDDGSTSKVVVSGGRRDNKPALFVRLLDASGTEKTWIILTVDDTIMTHMDFPVQSR